MDSFHHMHAEQVGRNHVERMTPLILGSDFTSVYICLDFVDGTVATVSARCS